MLLRPLATPAFAPARRQLVTGAWRRNLYTTTRGLKSDPLRILFCGSDLMSVESLHALHEEWRYNRELVEKIEVVVQPPKRTGRGFKKLADVPCTRAAEQLELPYHEIKTFTGWEMPRDINLIIAVSFGLFVPKRLLREAKYGGLNVHPSFLPDLRGPAPIHRAALRGDEYMGVSLQTMHEEQFDHGVVLSQTPAPGIRMMQHPTLSRTTRKLAMEGAELLVQALRDGLHLPPYQDAGWKAKELGGRPLEHAPKITPADTEVDWDSWTAADWLRRLQLKQAVWAVGEVDGPSGRIQRRLLLHDARQVPEDEVRGDRGMMEVLTRGKDGEERRCRKTVSVDTRWGNLYLLLDKDVWLRVRRATLESQTEKPAASAAKPFVVEWENGVKNPGNTKTKEKKTQ